MGFAPSGVIEGIIKMKLGRFHKKLASFVPDIVICWFLS